MQSVPAATMTSLSGTESTVLQHSPHEAVAETIGRNGTNPFPACFGDEVVGKSFADTEYHHADEIARTGIKKST